MKKHFLSMLAMATMLFATGCSDEENIVENNQQNVTFNIALEDGGTGSRAIGKDANDTEIKIGKGYYVDKLYYAVYEENKQALLVKGSADINENGKFSVTIPLVNNLNFDIAFFAHDKDASAFDVPANGDLRDLTFKTNLLANQETYDAFSKVITHKATSQTTNDVVLERILAQLNVATIEQDLNDAQALGANATHSKIKLTGVYTKFDARTGIASVPDEVVYETAPILRKYDANTEHKNELLTVGTDNYYYLAMAYALVNTESDLFKSELTFYRAHESNAEVAGDAVSVRTIPNLPLQRNYRTNVTGSILTQDENFSITLDTDFGVEDHNVESDDIALVEDIDITEVAQLNNALKELLKVEKEVILNVKGLKNYASDIDIVIPVSTSEYPVKATGITLNLLDLNKDFKVTGTEFADTVVVATDLNTTIDKAEIIIPNSHVKVIGNYTNLTISSSSTTLEVAEGSSIGTLTVMSGNVAILNGGKVDEIVKHSSNQDTSTIVTVEPGGVLTNEPGTGIKVDTTPTTEDGVWVLSENVEVTRTINIPANKELTIDLNGYTLSQVKEQTVGYQMILNDGNLTIMDSKGNGKISYTDSGNGGEYISDAIYNRGVLVINGGTIENLSSATVAKNGYPHAVDTYSGIRNTSVTINGGTIYCAEYSAVRMFCVSATYKADLVINGGTIKGAIDMQNGTLAAALGTLTINDGIFETTKNANNIRFANWNGGATEYGITAAIKGGSFNGGITTAYVPAAANWNKGIISGGTFSNDPADFLAAGYLKKEENSKYIVYADEVAKIGETTYPTLNKAIEAVNNGGTITLLKDVTFSENNRTNNGGSWYEGLLYDGDKSFTLDLNDKTITNDEYVNDYLLYFKNNGDKANTITIKNGTITAGSSAYAAIATASSNTQKITMNLEDVSINGNNSNGAVVKFRGGGELNVKAGTIVNGNDNYVGIEVYGTETVANIYEGVEIYQKGTNSNVGGIIGASGNATVNIKGGKGVSAKCGLIVMTSGGTINVEGGEWTANNDGTPESDNFAVLASQFDNATYPNAISSVMNVTGGTFKGGYNCYGNVADKAFIKITGGNFNADPTAYVVAGYEVSGSSGSYTVSKPKAQIALEEAIANGGTITLTEDVNLATALNIKSGDVTLDLNDKTITAASTSAFEVKNGAKLTLKNGKVVAYESTVRAIGGKAVIESGEYTSTGTALDTPSTYRYSLDCREGGELIVNGGTFKSNNGMINVGSAVTINGGKFENIVEKTMTRHFAYVSGKITINDGEFYGVANSAAGGCFFCGAAAGCDIQIKGGKFTSLWTSGSVNKIFEVYYGGTINVTGGLFNTNGGISSFVEENTNEATKAAYPYAAK